MNPTTTHKLSLGLTSLASVLGLLSVSGGIYGLLKPQAFAATMGVPLKATAPNSEVLPFVSFVASRNLGTGLATLTLVALGKKKSLGISMLAGVVVCLADAWVCANYDAEDGKAAGHAFMGGVAGLLGAGLVWLN